MYLFFSVSPSPLKEITVGPVDGSTVLFNKAVSEMQSDVTVADGAITGTLAFIAGGLAESGPLSGDGWFMALQFSSDDWAEYDDIKVGLDPSQGTGLVSVKNNPDRNGVFKVTNTSQKFIVQTTVDDTVIDTEYSLSNLVLTPAPVPVSVDPQLYQVVTDMEALSIQEGVYNYQLETGETDSAQISYIDAIAGCTITSCAIDGEDYELTSTTGSHGGLRYTYHGELEFAIYDGSAMTIVTKDNNGNSLTYTIRYGGSQDDGGGSQETTP